MPGFATTYQIIQRDRELTFWFYADWTNLSHVFIPKSKFVARGMRLYSFFRACSDLPLELRAKSDSPGAAEVLENKVILTE